MIRKHGWKALGVLILLYVFTVGLLTPLKPGIVDVHPNTVRTGDNFTLNVLGYNSNFLDNPQQLRAWLKLNDELALASSGIKALNNRELLLTFALPEYLPVAQRVQDFSLVIDNPADGPSVLPSAVFVTQDSIDPETGKAQWVNSPIDQLSDHSGFAFPFRNILAESIRNAYFHIPMWFAMIFVFLAGVINCIRYLRKQDILADARAEALTRVGILLGAMGLASGAVWAKYTWGAFWSNDIKQTMTAVALLIYLAYFVLRNAVEDPEKKARLSAVYNLFAFAALIPLIYVVPRLRDSLHPGAGGNPALGGEDLDSTMRMVFYPAIIGWTLLAFWIAQLSYRMRRLELTLEDQYD